MFEDMDYRGRSHLSISIVDLPCGALSEEQNLHSANKACNLLPFYVIVLFAPPLVLHVDYIPLVCHKYFLSLHLHYIIAAQLFGLADI